MVTKRKMYGKRPFPAEPSRRWFQWNWPLRFSTDPSKEDLSLSITKCLRFRSVCASLQVVHPLRPAKQTKSEFVALLDGSRKRHQFADIPICPHKASTQETGFRASSPLERMSASFNLRENLHDFQESTGLSARSEFDLPQQNRQAGLLWSRGSSNHVPRLADLLSSKSKLFGLPEIPVSIKPG